MQEAENIRLHKALIEKPELRKGFDVALAEMTKAVCSLANGQDLTKDGVMVASAISFQIIRGAHEFSEVFFRLAEPSNPPPRPRPAAEALDHNVN
jgi:hypothetical protein